MPCENIDIDHAPPVFKGSNKIKGARESEKR
jgi:hypothetical protein